MPILTCIIYAIYIYTYIYLYTYIYTFQKPTDSQKYTILLAKTKIEVYFCSAEQFLRKPFIKQGPLQKPL